jgi:hypothetical protein
MKQVSVGLGPVLAAIAGCAGPNGTYAPDSPGCVAFEGQTITLDGSRFVIDKFTDSVEVDAAGKAIDSFPGYPMRGDYRIEGNVLYMRSDTGTDLPMYYFAEIGGSKWLLTQSEYEEWTRDGSVGPCALARSGRSEN